MRQVLATALVALVVGALAGATVSAVAQSDSEVIPSAVSPVNADKVDGKHAVSAGASRARRAGKLVATNAQGYLPNNILNPRPIMGVTLQTIFEGFEATNAVNTTMTVDIDCPDGAQVTGGGFNFTNLGDAVPTVQAVRSNPEGEGWEFAVLKVAPDPTSGAPRFRVWARCLTT
jgi:hypothetical protein